MKLPMEQKAKPESNPPDQEELGSLECGDLGLGKGLKPGGIPKDDVDYVSPQLSVVQVVKQPASSTNKPNDTLASKRTTKRSKLAEKLRRLRKAKSETKSDEDLEVINDFPAFAEVPLGTSIRQQKKLFEHNLDELFSRNGIESDTPVSAKKSSEGSKINNEVVQKKLRQALEEVDFLRQDLELCHKQLDAKYKAIKILQKQAFAVQSQQLDKTLKAKQLNRVLQHEINKLEFDLECQQSSVLDSQETWSQRFDRVCQEKSTLASKLKKQTEELRKVQAEKMAVCRERDELLAMVDVQERQRYDSIRSHSVEDAYTTFTSGELAILGACHCRGQRPEPCGCAYAAASLKRDLVSVMEELDLEKQQREEADIRTDAYRIAFDEQLSRNRTLTTQIAALMACPPMRLGAKAKAAVRWLIKQISEDDDMYNGQLIPGDLNMNSKLMACIENKSEEELIYMLLDMITDRTEALAHQRLAARLLANRTQELEAQLTANQEEVFDK